MASVSRSCPECGESFPDEVFFCGRDGTITVQDQDPGDFDSRLGKQLGGYIVVARVADGAMGRVFEGRHPDTRARVAIKVLHADVVQDRVAVERFKREFETVTEMEHPYIVRVLEFGDTPDASYFMTMEYLVGEELGKALAPGQPLPPARVLRLACQTAVALEYAHSFGFIHRDLKPDNIFLCESEDGDEVRILDFGSVKLQMELGAKLTAIGTTVGSPFYMSPEQAMGRSDVDQRTDVFALSAIIYEMLTGKVAFEAPTVAKILMRIMNDSPDAPSQVLPAVPASVDAVVDRGLRKEKEERYATACELARDLLRAYGLSGDAQAWARKPVAEIEAALAEAERPPAPQAEPAASAEPAMPVAKGPPTQSTLGLATEDPLTVPAGVGGGGMAKLALIAVGVLVIGGVLALLLR